MTGMLISMVVGSLGAYYMLLGKKRGDGTYMLIGAGLVIASYWLF